MKAMPLNALRTFEAVASRLSFSGGAEALNVSPAAVSSQVRALEEHLGQTLFIRHGRSVELTDAGRRLLPGVQRGLSELRKAMQSIDPNRSEGVLNVSMVPIFLQKWMMPKITRFYRVAPQIDLRINADSKPVNFDETDFHCAIRFGPGKWQGLRAVKLMDDWILPVCSPGLLEKIGPIGSTAELQKHNLLYAPSAVWDPWFRDIGVNEEDQRLPRLNDALSTLLAAEQGQGIALSRWSLVARDIAGGRLVRPVQRVVRTEWSYYFVAPPHYFELPKVKVFRQWMVELCEQFEKPVAT